MTGVAFAHCPGDDGNFQASAEQGLPSAASAAKGAISCTALVTTCGDWSFHSVDLQRDTGFVQVGWQAISNGPVLAYCEYQHRNDNFLYGVQEFDVSLGTHVYEWSYGAAATDWHCRLDGGLLTTIDYGAVGFGTGGKVSAQGEAWEKHGQVGKLAPAAPLFSGLRWRRASNAVWSDMDLTRNPPEDPYGSSVPEPGKFQVWTNAH